MAFDLLSNFAQRDAARTVAAFLFCCALGLILGNRAIAWLQTRFREPIKSISPTVVRLHQHKAKTPTMGGLFIVIGVLLGSLVFGNWVDAPVLLALTTLVLFAAIGAVDDLVKLRTPRRGTSAPAKLAMQVVAAVGIAFLLGPTLDEVDWTRGAMHVIVLVGAANAVNLTDGLDGLASGCGLIAAVAIAFLLVFAGSYELAVVSSALAGTLAAFLWFNRHPARVFMGDTGSQAIGSLLGYLTISSGNDWLCLMIGGVFVVEAASVVLQMASYKVRGKRLFLCAPLHHHFEFAGWAEPAIVRLFYSTSLLFAGAGICLPFAMQASQITRESASTGGNLAATSRVQALETDSQPLPGAPIAQQGRLSR